MQPNNSSSITSSNHLLINNPVHPTIKLPFPPKIDPLDLIPVKPSSPQATQSNFKPTRSPNAFIIYRKAFVKAAREEGQCLPMTVISSMASSSWEQEPDEVKAEYKRIAKAAYLKRKELYPKERKRRRKERWNIVSFNTPTTTTTNNTSDNNNNIIISDDNNIVVNDNNNIVVSDNTLLSPLPLSSTSSSAFSSPIAPNSSESLEYSPQIDSKYDSNYMNANNFTIGNNYDSLLLTPEFSNPSNLESINFNFNEFPNIYWDDNFNLIGHDVQLQKQSADNNINNDIYKNNYYDYYNNNYF